VDSFSGGKENEVIFGETELNVGDMLHGICVGLKGVERGLMGVLYVIAVVFEKLVVVGSVSDDGVCCTWSLTLCSFVVGSGILE